MNFTEFEKLIPKGHILNGINNFENHHDVFISYSPEDQERAFKICYILEQNNLKCWIAPRNVTSGEHYLDAISNAIKSTKCVLLLFSQFSQESKYVYNEIHHAIRWGRKIISINVDNSKPVDEIKDLLSDAIWIDACESESDFYNLVKIMHSNIKYFPSNVYYTKKRIFLDSDIIFDDNYESGGIKLNRDNLVIDGNGHTIDAQGKTRIFYCTSKNITIKNITLKNGYAEDGGFIFNYGGELTIEESTITQDVADCDGGAINNYEGNLKIFNCEFSNISSQKNIINNKDSLEIYNSAFLSNQAENIIVNENNRSSLSVINGKFKDNIIFKSIIFNSGKNCLIEKSIFENKICENNSQNLLKTIFKKYIFKNDSKNIINKSNLTLISPIIKDDGKTVLNKGHIHIKNFSQDFLRKINGNGTIQMDMDLIPNSEKFDFGYLDKIIHEDTTNEIILDEDICLEDYERDFYEGGIELERDNLTIDGKGRTIDGADKSRIFLITGNNITLKNIIFKNGHSHKNYDNILNSNGGAIKINSNLKLTLENCKFINNVSEENGGAIYYFKGNLTISKSKFKGNLAKGFAGAVFNDDRLTISGVDFKNNHAFYGGSIANTGELNILNSNFNKNEAPLGGAIFNRGELTISDSSFNENISSLGGAIFNSTKLSISKSLIEKNMAKDILEMDYDKFILNIDEEGLFDYFKDEDELNAIGGAIFNNGELIIMDSTLTENVAREGGAIFGDGNGGIDIADSILSQNMATNGGAICIGFVLFEVIGQYLKGGTLNISESKLNRNIARKGHGGAIYFYRSSDKYESNNCTFENNRPDDVNKF
ncbi:TIR domain-containing protein [uncultured Methanobrevibacter sp.]|uniref:TIR domain-containing protein n=1 Tax=uncultured Methanobrevibacter sp. TaxID=253161 RepID=UPI00260A840F|nr:TIR domain-containing protein [uncultured Methanobrevibacter sp.]